jgi:hypothetical protein
VKLTPWIVMPTYWTWPSSAAARLESGSFDHPTPLDGESTLPRLLQDLSGQSAQDFRLLILVGTAHPSLGTRAAAHVSDLLRPYQDRLSSLVMDWTRLERLQSVLSDHGLTTAGLGLESYAGIRNLQLLVPHILGAEAVVALDDDERVETDYLQRAISQFGPDARNPAVLGLAGPYRQPDGGVLLPARERTGNVFEDKAIYINQAMGGLMAGGEGLRPSPMALGGNMVFHASLLKQTPFDPGITRGEDIDYLINARMGGVTWWFDAGLSILHLPPHHYDSSPFQRLRQDVMRFMYERQKLHLFGWSQPDWLEPYPGALLGPDLEDQARQALERQGTPALWAEYGEPDSILQEASARAGQLAPQYAGFAADWQRMMERIESDQRLRGLLAAALDWAGMERTHW